MKNNKYLFAVLLLAVILVVGVGMTALYVERRDASQDQEEFTVVTSFYPMYIAAKNVIGDCADVRLENLSEPQTGCLHDYQLTAEDMKLLSTADVFIINGGGIETFLADVASSYPDLQIIDECASLELLGENAHVWMNMEYYEKQVQTICDGLSEADEAHGDIYSENAEEYIRQIDELIGEAGELESLMSDQPVILLHEAYEYLAEEYGAVTSGLLNLDEEQQVSAGEVAELLQAINESDVSVVLAEELYGKDTGDTLEEESDVKVVYLDTLVRGDGSADSYLTGMRENMRLLTEAFTQTGGSE